MKVTIMFRGREMAHPELGKAILDHVAEQVVHPARVEVVPQARRPRNMIMVLAPDKKAQAGPRRRARRRPRTPTQRARPTSRHRSSRRADGHRAVDTEPPTRHAAEPSRVATDVARRNPRCPR